jgi:guanylate kinase
MTGLREPRVFIVSGPSGSGKSTLVKKLLELPGTLLSISCTTRPPRNTETNGEWYNFVTPEEFERMVERGEFLEHAKVFGRHWYGTPRHWYEEARRTGKDLVLEIDVQGAEQVKLKLRDAVAIFILPPSRAVLEQRIRARGQDSAEEIGRRMERARQEMLCYIDYDYVVVNDDVERAGREVQAIALAARCARAQSEERVRGILESFGG